MSMPEDVGELVAHCAHRREVPAPHGARSRRRKHDLQRRMWTRTSTALIGGSFMTKVGFIGLGSQGGPMPRRIVDTGFPLTLWARRPAVPRTRTPTPRAATRIDYQRTRRQPVTSSGSASLATPTWRKCCLPSNGVLAQAWHPAVWWPSTRPSARTRVGVSRSTRLNTASLSSTHP